MKPPFPPRRILRASIAVFGAAFAAARPASADDVSVRDAVVIVGAGEASSVRHAAGDLRDFLREAGGGNPELRMIGPSDAVPGDARPGAPLLFVGPRAYEAAPGGDGGASSVAIPPGAYEISSGRAAGRALYRLGGSDPAAVVAAVMTLEQRARVGNGDVSLPADLQETSAPRWRRRGVYAHQHWAYRRPYSLRDWTAEDWTRYVDLLAHLRYNLLQLWTMEGICPHPLSDGDRPDSISACASAVFVLAYGYRASVNTAP